MPPRPASRACPPRRPELSVSAEKRRRDALQTPELPGFGWESHDLESRDRLGLAFHLEMARIAPLKNGLSQAVGRRADQDGEWLRVRLQPSCGVERIAGRSVFHTRPASHCTEHGEASLDPHADADLLDVPLVLHLGRVCPDCLDYPYPGPDGPLGVVFVGLGGAKERENAVAGKVLDGSPELLDHLDDPGHGPTHDLCDVLGIEPLAERGGADDVGEKRCDDLALLAHDPVGGGISLHLAILSV
jgi:hypothetical protein